MMVKAATGSLHPLYEWIAEVQKYNASKPVDKYYEQGWNTLYPINTYVQSTTDENLWRQIIWCRSERVSLRIWKRFYRQKPWCYQFYSPYGNSASRNGQKAAIPTRKQLGADNITDFLTVSFSSPDYIGHDLVPTPLSRKIPFFTPDMNWAISSISSDTKVGKGQYLVFLSADHGAAHARFGERKQTVSWFDQQQVRRRSCVRYRKNMGSDKLIASNNNYQIFESSCYWFTETGRSRY